MGKHRLSVAYNWDPRLIEEVVKNKYPVKDFFASAQHTTVGGGRPSSILPETTEKIMKQHIKKMHDAGIEFMYASNAPCMGGQEFVRETHEKMLKEFEWIQGIGVDGVILAIPYLMELVKEQFPKLKIRVSTVAKVNTVNKAKYFEALGATSITPDVMINRNFKVLEKMAKGTSCDLDLVVTDGCLYECPFRLYHYSLTGHASQTYSNRDAYIDYPILRCNIEKFTHPAEAMKCRWIRPEDLKHYEAIGIHNFKIGGRRLTADIILRSVKAYTEQKYDGNLTDIIEGFSFEYGGVKEDPNKKMGMANATEKKANMVIDNTKLDGFIDFFKKQDCAANCADCNYCDEWAKKAITIDQEGVEIFLNSVHAFHDDLITSREFGLGKAVEGAGRKTKKGGMDWDPLARKNFDEIIGRSPPATRGMARMVIGSLAEKTAKKRGATKVENDDVSIAFLTGVPGPFQKGLKGDLKELGMKCEV
ncbi:MAG: U32 family peptidase [Candidatus Lokiarchaeota archaeon]|nr:U32 family peptidase [Candidatus Lokiarchaeota archaeon]